MHACMRACARAQALACKYHGRSTPTYRCVLNKVPYTTKRNCQVNWHFLSPRTDRHKGSPPSPGRAAERHGVLRASQCAACEAALSGRRRGLSVAPLPAPAHVSSQGGSDACRVLACGASRLCCRLIAAGGRLLHAHHGDLPFADTLQGRCALLFLPWRWQDACSRRRRRHGADL